MKKRSTGPFRRIPPIKDARIRTELGRAHLLVALLAFALIASLSLNIEQGPSQSALPAGAAIILLILVGLFSLLVAVGMFVTRR